MNTKDQETSAPVRRRPTAAEIFHSINRLAAEAEWTEEELNEELRAGGVDPDELVRSAREHLEKLTGRKF